MQTYIQIFQTHPEDCDDEKLADAFPYPFSTNILWKSTNIQLYNFSETLKFIIWLLFRNNINISHVMMSLESSASSISCKSLK